ncbi:uncharacterized threonine-rich GPI-anchored glycoprotein PJ4664.02-like [Xiphophorus hellerii]|uniref:uncharacterized threonine-rich GPI-anchored glycoprotein PJ4664.02-like n=1 Tax=Xiphophorus hellerii TaxID=8084 RepID=UPI0013B3F6F7|nr:uncharacterized threonine-rich GPI-anchored glycoprotein PJ4664.02-like [Xiphophorus hellerii]
MAVGASLRLLAALILTLPGFAQSFMPNSFFSWTLSHRDITQIAILRKTAEVCRDVAAAEGRSFTLEITDTLSVNKVQTACSVPLPGFPVSSEMLQAAINSVHDSSDALLSPDPAFHFHSEAFLTGRDLITQGLSSLKASVKEQNFQAARNTLGRICHTLQDFYSHSNWVELGRTAAYSALIRPDQPLENLAGPDVPTCKSCAGLSCKDNILPAVLEQGLLTSGYYSTESPAKPAGKCSHGGVYDQTSRTEPTGGINKDTNSSSHGQLHRTAADLAVDATVDLLEDIRVAIGDRAFLRLMDISQAPALVFVVDTTGSMGDDITYVQTVTATIINERRGTPIEPFEYILVPFNDTEFGPVMRTTDADEMMTKINSLTPSGGADGPKMSLSGLRLALTAAPPSSFIVLFTDAEAKDASLKNAVTALIETTKSKVFPILTYFNARRRKRTVTVASSKQLDLDLAQASGGLAIEISKSQISAATPIIEQFSVGAVVTVLHAAVDPGTPRNLTFLVDTTLSYVLIYITGDSSLTFTLTSSTGVSQSSSESSGSLASISTAGNLWVLRLNPENQAGQWAIALNSNTAYTVKVTGRSSLNFVYNLVEPQEGTNGSVIPKEGRPSTGDNVTLWVTVTGSDTATVRDVSLFDFSRSTQVNGSVQSIGNGDYLVAFSEVPAGSFLLQLTGQETNSTSAPTSFQRQASTQITPSSLSVTVSTLSVHSGLQENQTFFSFPLYQAQADSLSIEPGSSVSVSFTVSSEETGTFTIQANNDRGFGTARRTSVSIGAGDGGQANGTVTLATPADAASGTDVSLTIVAENADGTEINYVVLRFSISTKVTDLSAPVCQVVRMSGVCPASPLFCASVHWELVVNFTDGISGTGIETISLRQGNGTLKTSNVVEVGGENITVVSYSSTCCSQNVQLAAVDRVGNVGTCTKTAIALTTPAPSSTPSLVTNISHITTTIPVLNSTSASTPMLIAENMAVVPKMAGTTPVTTPMHMTNTTPVTTPMHMTNTTPVTTPMHMTNTTPVTTPMHMTNTTPVTTPMHMTNTTPETTPMHMTNTTPETTPMHMTNTTPVTTPMHMTNTTPVTTPMHMTNTTPETTPMHMTNTTPVTTPMHMTNTTPVTTPMHMTNTTPETTPMHMTNTTPVTTPMHMTNTTPVTTPMHMTNTTPVTTPMHMTNTTPVTTPMHMTNTTPVTTPMHMTNTTPVTTPMHMTNTTPVTTPMHMTNTTPVTTPMHMTNTTPVTTPMHMTNTTPVTTPMHMTNTTPVTTPMHMTNTTPVTTPMHMTNTTPVTTPMHMTNTTPVTATSPETPNVPHNSTPAQTTNSSVVTTVFETAGTTISTSTGGEPVCLSYSLCIAAMICSIRVLFFNEAN